ncbi:MAG: hypothetical protein JSW71_00075 [Gemmatimonadota bacterium]|nr:MAG: hypothetical protein JSW71_00075 [Gemmatimonadota bacterium]
MAQSGQPAGLTAIASTAAIRDQARIDKANVYVPQVGQHGQHVPHEDVTGSMLVVLIRRHDEILGAVHIESELPDGFGKAEQTAVAEVADALAALL